MKLDTVMCYVGLTAKHWIDYGRLSTPLLGNPTLSKTRHCNVLRATYCKTFEKRLKVVYTGVGYPLHSMKLNTVMCYVQLTTKYSSNEGKVSFVASAEGNVIWEFLWHTNHCVFGPLKPNFG